MKRSKWTRDGLMRTKGSNASYGYLALLLPFIILAIGYATRLVFPFGDRHILTVDLFHQYAPFLNELRDKILSGDSLFYSFRGGLGVNFYALFAYYLASPLNIILVIFPKAFIAEAVLMLTLIKVALAGYTFNLLLGRAYLRTGPLSVAFSTMYALSAYQMAYAWNVMWLDAIYTMPIVILGLVLLVREKNYWLYPLSVAYLLFVNYYMAMFVLIFTFFYFPVLLFQFAPRGFREKLFASLRTFGLTLLGIGMSAVLIWPTFKSLQLTSAAGDKFPTAIESTFELINYYGQHFMLVEPTVRDGMPNLYAGTLLLLLIPIYFLASSIRLWKRVANLAILGFLIVSFNTNILNFLWHGTHFPNQLPYRNSFVYIFFLIFILYDALPAVKTFSNRELGFIGIVSILLVLISAPDTSLRFTPLTVYLTILFMLIYTLVLSRFKTARQKKQPIAFILLSVIFFEMVVHTGGSLYYLDKNEYFGRREGYAVGVTAEAIRKAQNMLEETDESLFFRTEIVPDKTSNDPFLYGLNGSTIFASTMRKAGVTFFRNLGYSSNGINSYKYDGQTLLMDSLLGIRYLIHRDKLTIDEKSRVMTLKNEEGNVYVYENRQALPLGYVVDNGVNNFKSDNNSPFGNQIRLVQAMLPDEDVADVLKPVELTVTNNAGGVLTPTETFGLYNFSKDSELSEATYTLSWDTTEAATTYLAVDIRGNKGRHAEVVINEERFTASVRRGGIIDLGYVPADANVEVNIVLEAEAASSGDIEVYVATLTDADVTKIAERLNESPFVMNTFSSSRITGSVKAAKDGKLFFSIPYDPGWTISLDGSPVEIEQIDESLMAIAISEGSHEIDLSFKPDGFTTGLLVSLVSLLLFILLTIVRSVLLPRIGRRRETRREQKRLATGLTDSLEVHDLYLDESLPDESPYVDEDDYVHGDVYGHYPDNSTPSVAEEELDYAFKPEVEDLDDEKA